MWPAHGQHKEASARKGQGQRAGPRHARPICGHGGDPPGLLTNMTEKASAAEPSLPDVGKAGNLHPTRTEKGISERGHSHHRHMLLQLPYDPLQTAGSWGH